MTSANVDTVIIFTTDHEALAGFYEQALGLESPQRFGEGHIGYQLDSIYLGFDQVDDVQPGRSTTLWFRVDDIEATFEQCVDLEASVRYPPTEKPFGDTVAALIDPDGNHFGLSQRTGTVEPDPT